MKWKTETVAVESANKPVTFEAKRPMREGEHELEDLNKAPFVIRAIPFLGRENLEHKPTSDLGHSLPGVGVLGAGRSIGLSGHSIPGPDVQAKKSGDIPGQNADDIFSSQTASE